MIFSHKMIDVYSNPGTLADETKTTQFTRPQTTRLVAVVV